MHDPAGGSGLAAFALFLPFQRRRRWHESARNGDCHDGERHSSLGHTFMDQAQYGLARPGDVPIHSSSCGRGGPRQALLGGIHAWLQVYRQRLRRSHTLVFSNCRNTQCELLPNIFWRLPMPTVTRTFVDWSKKRDCATNREARKWGAARD